MAWRKSPAFHRWEEYKRGRMSETDYWQAAVREISAEACWTDLQAGVEAIVRLDMELAR